MAQKFKIATSAKMGEFFTVGEKSNVSEDFFYQTVETKVKKLTVKNPEKYDEVLQTAKSRLKQGQSLTILDTWFQVSGRP